MIRVLTIIALIVIGFLSEVTAQEIVIGKSETIDSKVLKESRKILVSLPEDYEKSGYSYPVVYFTDAESHFELMVSTTNFLVKSNVIPPLILVGIEAGSNRTRDLTPRVFDEEDKKHPWFQNTVHGGAQTFLAFIEQDLIPHIDKKYRTADFKVLSGHSFGGLFSFYTYVNKPHLFDGVMAMSPSLGWDKERMVNEASEKIEQNVLLKKPLFLSKGNERGSLETGYKSAVSLFEKNKQYPVTTQEFPDESHLSVVFDSQYKGLQAMFSEWDLPYQESAKGIERVKKHNKKVKELYNINFTSQSWLINLGNSLFYKKDYDAAITAYKYNIDLFPRYAYSYFQLAKTYEKINKRNLALVNYEKANELVPMSSPYKSLYASAVKNLTEGVPN